MLVEINIAVLSLYLISLYMSSIDVNLMLAMKVKWISMNDVLLLLTLREHKMISGLPKADKASETYLALRRFDLCIGIVYTNNNVTPTRLTPTL